MMVVTWNPTFNRWEFFTENADGTTSGTYLKPSDMEDFPRFRERMKTLLWSLA